MTIIGHEPIEETDEERDDAVEHWRYQWERQHTTKYDGDSRDPIEAWFEAGEPDGRF